MVRFFCTAGDFFAGRLPARTTYVAPEISCHCDRNVGRHFAFRRDGPLPPRIDLATGKIRILDVNEFKGKGGKIPGGSATVLDLPLDENKPLKSLTVRALANEVVIGLMGVTLQK